jgi:hypothetical protein
MAHREPLRPIALKVQIMFEPSRGTPDCVAQAYEHVVPLPHRTIAGSPLARLPGGEDPRQHGREERAS